MSTFALSIVAWGGKPDNYTCPEPHYGFLSYLHENAAATKTPVIHIDCRNWLDRDPGQGQQDSKGGKGGKGKKGKSKGGKNQGKSANRFRPYI